MDAMLEAALGYAALLLTDRRDGYAVVRRDLAVPTEAGLTDGPPLPLTRALVLAEDVVGYCRLPSTAIDLAATLTTYAPPGVVYVAVHGYVADTIRVVAGQSLIPATAN